MNHDSKLDSFKEFVRNNSFLIRYIRSGEKTWQGMYEIYDLYGEDEEAWKNYLEKNDNSNKSNHSKNSGYFDELVRMAKNIDVNKVQESITSLQKTLGLFGELFVNKNGDDNGNREYNPRPLYRRFED